MKITTLSPHSDLKVAITEARATRRSLFGRHTYVLKVDKEVHAVALSIFDRIAKAVIETIGWNYFQLKYNNASVYVLYRPPVELEGDIKKVVDETPKFTSYSF